MNNRYLLENCGEDDEILVMFHDNRREVIMSRDLVVDFKDSRFIAYRNCGTGNTVFVNLSEIKSIEIFSLLN